MFVKHLLWLIFSGICLGQLPEYNVTHTDMSQEMREFAVGESLIMLSNGTDLAQVAKKLVPIMNTKYGKGWFSLVGANPDINELSTTKNTTLQMQFKNDKLTIAQQLLQVQSCNNSAHLTKFDDVIQKARNSQIVIVESIGGDTNTRGQLEQDIKVGLSKDNFHTCDKTTLIGNWKNWCFRTLSLNIEKQIVSHANLTSKKIVASSGFMAQHFSYGSSPEYIFTVGDLYIDIRIFD